MKNVDERRMHTYIADLVAATKHTLKAVEEQKESAHVMPDDDAFALLQLMEKKLRGQIPKLSKQSDRFESESFEGTKRKLAGFLGTIAGLIDKARKDPVSQLMRDNYTAVALLTASNITLKSAALAADDEELQHIAGSNLQELAQLTTEISRYLPLGVARELIDNDEEAERIGKIALEKTQKAWKSENIKDREKVV